MIICPEYLCFGERTCRWIDAAVCIYIFKFIYIIISIQEQFINFICPEYLCFGERTCRWIDAAVCIYVYIYINL